MSGAAGHLNHIYEDRSITFAEIQEILIMAASGTLENVTEKLDGMNIVFTWDLSLSKLKVARSCGDIKKGGMDAATLASKFRNRGNVEKAFNCAFVVIENAISSLTEEDKKNTFGNNGNIWYSAEVIYKNNPNVIKYDTNNIVFHSWPVFELFDNGKIIKREDFSGIELLSKKVNNIHNSTPNWNLGGPISIKLKKLSNRQLLTALNEINKLMFTMNMKDSESIEDYLRKILAKEICNLNFSREVSDALISRILETEDCPTVTDIKKNVPKEKHQIISEIVKNSSNMIKNIIFPIEKIIHNFSVEILRDLRSAFVKSQTQEIKRIKSEVEKAVQFFKSKSKDSQLPGNLNKQLEKLGTIDNINSTIEGVVFTYKGNVYKFTGTFAPVNQILGYIKYKQ